MRPRGARRARKGFIRLSTEHRSADATEWGNQAAVYVSDDPVWAGDAFVPQRAPVDLARLVSHGAARPLARIDVTPQDFPYRGAVTYYRDGEPIWVSMFRP